MIFISRAQAETLLAFCQEAEAEGDERPCFVSIPESEGSFLAVQGSALHMTRDNRTDRVEIDGSRKEI